MLSTTIRPEPFFDRSSELAVLDRGWNRKHGGQMALVYGRRRIGKTYLLQRYFTTPSAATGMAKPHCYFLAEQSTAHVQRLSLAQQLLAALPAPSVTPQDLAVSWNSLLRHLSQQALAQRAERTRFALVLDEFPYLVAQTPELPSIIQAWWDREGVHAPVFVVLCGSQLSSMAAMGRESAPLFGRFNAGVLLIEPLRYDDVASFYENSDHYGLREKLLMYGVFGGTPRYHAMVDTSQPLADEIVDLLMRPRAILENEVRYLLSSEQIRDPAPYNAVLAAIASGCTQYGRIQQSTAIDKNAVAFFLRVLQELGWIRRTVPFGETSDRRAIYEISDPFLHFWYRFVAPLASELQFSDPKRVYEERVAPFLADYMGRHVFEAICTQWLQKHAQAKWGLSIQRMGRYWSRDGQTEIDIVAELMDGSYLFGECKWSAQKPLRLATYSELLGKVRSLPDRAWTSRASYALFSVGGFAPEVQGLAAAGEPLRLVDGGLLL